MLLVEIEGIQPVLYQTFSFFFQPTELPDFEQQGYIGWYTLGLSFKHTPEIQPQHVMLTTPW